MKSINLPLHQITDKELGDWFAAHPEWKPETRRSYRAGLRGFFAWALKRGHVTDDPALEIDPVSIPRAVANPAPEVVYQQALLSSSTRVQMMLRLAAEAGLRRGEISRVNIDDVRESRGGPELLVHGKGNHERMVPITSDIAALIVKTATGAAGWLFPSRLDPANHVTPEWVGISCARVLPGSWSLHKLRHRFATRAYRGTHDIRAVQELLGHSSVAITQRYVACDGDDMRAAMMAAIPGKFLDAESRIPATHNAKNPPRRAEAPQGGKRHQ